MNSKPNINRINLMLGFSTALLCILLLSCGGSDPSSTETDAQKNQKLLIAGPWTMQSVTVDGTDKTTVYTGLKITFSNSGFTSTNGGAIWPATGTWSFTDNTGKTFTRNDGLTVSLNDIQTNKLILALVWSKSTLGPGRINSVSGQHVFTFSK